MNATITASRAIHMAEQRHDRERAKLHGVHSDSSTNAIAKRTRRPSVRKLIKDEFANGKWHSLDTIVEGLGADKNHILDTIKGMSKTGNFCCKVERKRVGADIQFRIFKKDKMVSLDELTEKLAPIIKGLKAEGKKNMATMSPATVAHLAGKLSNLLDGWAR